MNMIVIPSDHEMFSMEFSGEIDNFIYDEFGIAVKTGNKIEIGLSVFYEKGLFGTQICLSVLNNREVFDDVYYEIYSSDKNNDGMEVMCSSKERAYLNIGHDLAQLVIRIIAYIMSTPRKRIKKSIIPRDNKENKTENKKTSYEKENRIFLLDEIVEYVKENGLTITSNSTRKILCPCWSVRGHYRHYKSGKVVFVKNYKKGRERGNVIPKDKTYIV